MKRLLILLLLLFGALPLCAQCLRRDDTVQNAMGQALSGVNVYYLTQPANTTALTPLAATYADSACTIAKNPAVTDGHGHAFVYTPASFFTVVYKFDAFHETIYPDQSVNGGGGVPAPPLNAVQFNNPLGHFDGSSLFTFDRTTNTLNIGGTPTHEISIVTPSPLTSSYTQSLTATNDPFAYVHGTITPGHLATFFSDTEVQDGGAAGSSQLILRTGGVDLTPISNVDRIEPGSGVTITPSGNTMTISAAAGLRTLITPPALSAGQAYTVLMPTTVDQYSAHANSGINGSTNCAAGGSGWIDRIYGSGLSDWDVWCDWSGYSLPGGISPSSVVGVYGVIVSGANQDATPVEGAFGQGTVGYNAAITFSGTGWTAGVVGTGQSTVTLATGGAAAAFNFGTTSCAVDHAATGGGTMNAQTFVNACAILVVYTGTQTYSPNGIQVGYPLVFNQALNELTIPTPLPVSIGGSGTATPSLVAGSGISVSGSWPNQTITNTVGGSTASSALSGDVTMTSADTPYDGPAISAVAGTWLLQSTVTLYSGSNQARYTCKLWDGTTTAASTGSDNGNAATSSISLSAIVTPGSTTTYKVTCLNTSTGATMKAAATNNSAGNNATEINAIRLR